MPRIYWTSIVTSMSIAAWLIYLLLVGLGRAEILEGSWLVVAFVGREKLLHQNM